MDSYIRQAALGTAALDSYLKAGAFRSSVLVIGTIRGEGAGVEEAYSLSCTFSGLWAAFAFDLVSAVGTHISMGA
jgi:hypothetical protein